MSWLVDNATTFTILLVLVAAALVMIWRSSGQNKYLLYAAGALAVIGIIWLIALFAPSDRKQLRKNVDDMADAVIAGDVDDLFKRISKNFHYEFGGVKMTRDQLYQTARSVIQRGQVGSINITQFEVKEINRANKSARVKFKVTPFDGKGATMPPFVTQADFVLEGDLWKLKTVEFYKAFVDTDQKIGIPGL